MNWQFTASLTLGALVVWLAVGVGAYRRRLWRMADLDRVAHLFTTPAQRYAAVVDMEAFEERLALMTEGEILALAA